MPAGAGPARAADTIYWGNYSSNTIGFANVGGGGGGLLNTSPATPNEPNGLTIDSATGRGATGPTTGAPRFRLPASLGEEGER